MLQEPLEDRFKLKVHFENKGEVPVYVLTVARGGPKLESFKEGSCTPIESTTFLPPPRTPDDKRCNPGSVLNGDEPNINVVSLPGATLDQFAGLLTYPLFRTVIDKTGLRGRFDFHFEFATDENSPKFNPDGARGPSIFTALQKLGLRLDSDKAPRKVLLIDHVEKPSEN